MNPRRGHMSAKPYAAFLRDAAGRRAKVAKLHAQGMSAAAIAERVGLSRQRVYRILATL